jgi:uncharacterized membrane protein
LEDTTNLDITGFAWKERLVRVREWYGQKDQIKARKFLKDNNIKYIYWVKPQRAFLGDEQLGIKNIFENSGTVIYRVETD